MSQIKVLLNETIYRTKEQFQADNVATKYLTFGFFEYSLQNDEKIMGALLKKEDKSEEIYMSSLAPDQVRAITEKGFWQCLHNGKKCAEVIE